MDPSFLVPTCATPPFFVCQRNSTRDVHIWSTVYLCVLQRTKMRVAAHKNFRRTTFVHRTRKVRLHPKRRTPMSTALAVQLTLLSMIVAAMYAAYMMFKTRDLRGKPADAGGVGASAFHHEAQD